VKNLTSILQHVSLKSSAVVSSIVFLYSASQSGVCAEDPHAHHRHMAESQKSLVRSLAHYVVPTVNLIDSDGKESRLTEIISSKKPVMLNFIFTTCTAICPIMSASFAQVSKQIGAEDKELQLISISVDPEQDTPAKLKEYAKLFNSGSQWQLFTGTLGNSIEVQKAFDAYRGDKMNHLPFTFIRGANSNVWVRLEGLASANELIQELKTLPFK